MPTSSDSESLLFEHLNCLSAQLLESKGTVDEEIEFFDGLYRYNFVQDYVFISDFVQYLLAPTKQNTGDRAEKAPLDCLQENLHVIEKTWRQYQYGDGRGHQAQIERLHTLGDQIASEAARLRDVAAMEQMQTVLQDLASNLDKQRIREKKLSRKLEKQSHKIQSFERESVAILGIFAGVVLAFNAGVSFMTASLKPVVGSGLFALAFLVSLVGGILFDLLVVLLTFVRRIISEPYQAQGWPARRIVLAVNICMLICTAVFAVLSCVVR